MTTNKFMHGKRLPSQTSLAEYYEFVNMVNADDYGASAKWTPAVQLDLFSRLCPECKSAVLQPGAVYCGPCMVKLYPIDERG